MSIQDVGPTGMGQRGLDRVSAADPATRDASRTPAAETDKVDRIEVSLAARALAAEEDSTVLARNEQHAAAMRSVIEAGELASAERLERAARRLLGG